MRLKKTPRVYIAGKITGLDRVNALNLFAKAQIIIEDNEYEAVNPFDVCEDTPDKHWSDYMGECHRELLKCDAIVMLPNWHDSRGARIEYAVAREMGILVVFSYYDEGGDLDSQFIDDIYL